MKYNVNCKVDNNHGGEQFTVIKERRYGEENISISSTIPTMAMVNLRGIL